MLKYLGLFTIALSVGASDNNNNNNNNFVSDNNNARIISGLNSLPEASALVPVATQTDGMVVLACLKAWFSDMANQEPRNPEALPSEVLRNFEDNIDAHVDQYIQKNINPHLKWKLHKPFSFYPKLISERYSHFDDIYKQARKNKKNVAQSWNKVNKEFSRMYEGALEKFNNDLIDRLNNPLKSK